MRSGGRESGPRVLITGASGFLGAHAVREFHEAGYDVIGHGRDERRLAAALPPGAEAMRGDLASLADASINADAVVHGAALSTAWGPRADFWRANVDGTRAVIDLVRRNGVRRLVFVSSPSVYAAPRDRLNLTETDVAPGRPLNQYIASKLEAERVLREAHAAGDVPELVILRPRGLTGAGDPSLLPRLWAAHRRTGIPLIGGGGHLVDLTAVENVALALRLAVERPAADGRTLHLSNGEPRPFVDLVRQLFELLGEEPRLRVIPRPAARAVAAALDLARVVPGSREPVLTRYTLTTIAYSLTLDLTAARDVLGYSPRVSLDQALASLAAEPGISRD